MSVQESQKKAKYVKERNDHIKRELIKLFEFGTSLNRNYDMLRDQAKEYLKNVGMRNSLFNHISLASHRKLEDLQLQELMKKSEETRLRFLKKLKEELEEAEDRYLSSVYDKESLLKRQIIAMMQGKKHRNMFLNDIGEDKEEDLSNLRPIDFIAKTQSLKRGIGRINN